MRVKVVVGTCVVVKVSAYVVKCLFHNQIVVNPKELHLVYILWQRLMWVVDHVWRVDSSSPIFSHLEMFSSRPIFDDSLRNEMTSDAKDSTKPPRVTSSS